MAVRAHPDYPLLVAANRDEYYARPTRRADWWPENPVLLAGRDLQAGGTWLGVSRSGRIALVTNVRDTVEPPSSPVSRGNLAVDFLQGDETAWHYAERILAVGAAYQGFNLITGTAEELVYASNRLASPQHVANGIHGLANGRLDEPWPKVTRSQAYLQSILKSDNWQMEDVLGILASSEVAPDADLPQTGVGLALERFLSPAFISGKTCGTRASTVVTMNNAGVVHFLERSFPGGHTQQFQFSVSRPHRS